MASVQAETRPSHCRLSVAGGNKLPGEQVPSSLGKHVLAPKLVQVSPAAFMAGFPQGSNQGFPQASKRGFPQTSKQHCVTGFPQASAIGFPQVSTHSFTSFSATLAAGQAVPSANVGFPQGSKYGNPQTSTMGLPQASKQQDDAGRPVERTSGLPQASTQPAAHPPPCSKAAWQAFSPMFWAAQSVPAASLAGFPHGSV